MQVNLSKEKEFCAKSLRKLKYILYRSWRLEYPPVTDFFFRQGLVTCFLRMNNGWHLLFMSEQPSRDKIVFWRIVRRTKMERSKIRGMKLIPLKIITKCYKVPLFLI